MNTKNAFIFLGFGVAMALLPVLVPHSFVATGLGGVNGRALWLTVMGALQVVLGGGFLVLDHLLPLAVRWMEPATPRLAPILAFEAEDLRYARSDRILPQSAEREAQAA